MDNKRILITGVGGPTPRSIAMSLKSYNNCYKYELVGVDCDRHAIGLYQDFIFNKTYLVPLASDPCYWEQMDKIIRDNKIDIAIVQSEQEVLEWSRRVKQASLPCKVLIPEFNLVKLAIDKSEVSETLYPCGLAPLSLVFTKGKGSISEIENKLGYPFWVRGAVGSSGFGSLKVENKNMLEGWLAIKHDVDNFLASKYLPGRNLACKLLYYKGKLMRSACAQRVQYIMSKVSPSGITGNTSFGRMLNDRRVLDIARQGIEILFEKTGSEKHGLFTIDLKEDENGKPLITEVNVRHIAFTSCFAAAGANLVEDSIRLLLDDNSFERDFKLYEFKENLIFLRDVDALPVVIKESELL